MYNFISIFEINTFGGYSTRPLLDVAMGPYKGKKTGEHALLRQLMPSIKAGDVVLGDCYYPSYFLMASLILTGIHGVFPAHFARKSDFRRGKRLGKKDHLVSWKRPVRPSWMTQEEYDAFPDTITVRELAVEVKQPGFRTKIRILVTTFLSPDDVNKFDLANLYGLRWFVGVSRLRTLHLVGESPTEVKDSSLVAWEASWRESKTMEPSDNIFRKEYAQCTRL